MAAVARPRTPTRKPAARFPPYPYGFEPALDVYELHHPGDGGPSRWHASYSQSALSNAIRAPRHEFNMRNPELHAQMDVMADSLDRVQEQALALRRATGRGAVEDDRRLRSDLEIEVQELSTQVESLSLTVAALVQSLVGLGASAFNWSEGLGTPRRKGIAELVLSYAQPCSHIDPRLNDLCADLGLELAKERLDDVVARPWDDLANYRDGRSPAPGGPRAASPQKSKFQVKGVVQGSLQAWQDGGIGELSKSELRIGGAELGLGRLKITVICAQGLRKADALYRSDPYCVCEVPGRKGTKMKTKTVNNTQTPTWNHAFFSEYAKGDSLKFTVWDSDHGKDDLLGHAILQHTQFYPNGFRGEIPLELGGEGSTEPKLRLSIEVVDVPDLDEPQPETSPQKAVPALTLHESQHPWALHGAGSRR